MRDFRKIFLSSSILSVSLLALAGCGSPDVREVEGDAEVSDGVAYPTYGVHNDPSISPCAKPDCVYARGPGEPADPVYPEYWVSDWTMYRVFNGYAENPPPYRGAPPQALQPGRDYEISYGTTYYDSTWGNGQGAMMEKYDLRCLPIFPIPNNFSCAFISLGNTAYFLTYDRDRPSGMPPVCLFANWNHPPRRDFIKHLPYAIGDSQRLGNGGQGYSFWTAASTGRPIQIGVSPDRTADQAIMFGYAFAPNTAGEMQPQSFYFSGYPLAPANAPIVSQNYTDFAARRPDPEETWNLVKDLDPNDLPACQLFDPPSGSSLTATVAERAPTWADIGRWRQNGATR